MRSVGACIPRITNGWEENQPPRSESQITGIGMGVGGFGDYLPALSEGSRISHFDVVEHFSEESASDDRCFRLSRDILEFETPEKRPRKACPFACSYVWSYNDVRVG